MSGVTLLSVLANGLWQSALVALSAALVARLLVRRSAGLRYVYWWCVLAVAVLLPVCAPFAREVRREAARSALAATAWQAPVAGPLGTGRSLPAPVAGSEESGPERSVQRVAARSIVTPVSVSQRVVQLYLLIAVLMLGVLLRDVWRMARLKRRARPLPVRVEVLLARCRRESGVRRWLAYGASADINTPVFLGLTRPTLLLPDNCWTTLSERELLQIGAHELAHAQRYDDWLALVQRVVQALLFFQPAVRWIGTRLSLEREMACDEWAVQHVQAAPDDFAGTLLRMAERALRGPQHDAFAAALSGSCLRRRIAWLLSSDFMERQTRAQKRAALAMTTFALAGLSIAAAPTLDFVAPIPILPVRAALPGVNMAPAAIRQRLDAAFDGLAQAGFNGAVLVAVNDQIVLQRGFGVRNRRAHEPAQAGTLFQAGAIAKMLTGAAILRLEEQGRLSIQDPLSKWLGPLPAPKDQIRLHHLLVHASGLTPQNQPVYAHDEDDFIAGLRNTPAEFAPGTSQRHSDIAYSTLALVVQRASGMRYEDFVRKELLEPAGLHNTWFDDEAPRADMAVEYKTSADAGSAVGQRPYVWGRRGAMAVISNVEDLYRWELALRSGLFSKAQRTRMYDAGVNSLWGSNTGYGWETRRTTRNTSAWQRLSAWDGNSVELMRDERSKLTIVLFIDNRLNWDAPRYEAIARIALEGDPDGRAQEQLQNRWRN